MPRTPKRLVNPATLSNAAATKYTVPASTKTILRHIHAQNSAGSASSVTLSIGSDAVGTRIYDAYTLTAVGTAGSILDHWGYYVVEAAEIVQAKGGTLNDVVLTISGDEYTL